MSPTSGVEARMAEVVLPGETQEVRRMVSLDVERGLIILNDGEKKRNIQMEFELSAVLCWQRIMASLVVVLQDDESAGGQKSLELHFKAEAHARSWESYLMQMLDDVQAAVCGPVSVVSDLNDLCQRGEALSCVSVNDGEAGAPVKKDKRCEGNSSRKKIMKEKQEQILLLEMGIQRKNEEIMALQGKLTHVNRDLGSVQQQSIDLRQREIEVLQQATANKSNSSSSKPISSLQAESAGASNLPGAAAAEAVPVQEVEVRPVVSVCMDEAPESDDEDFDNMDFGECTEQAMALLAKIRDLESMTVDIEGENSQLTEQLQSEQGSMAARSQNLERMKQMLADVSFDEFTGNVDRII